MPSPRSGTRRDGKPRRFQVNAFGFGGSNYVVQVEQAMEDEDIVMVSLSAQADSQPQVVSAPRRFEGISLFTTEIGGNTLSTGCRGSNRARSLSLVERTEPFTNGGPVARKRIKALARQGIHIGTEDSAPAVGLCVSGARLPLCRNES